MSINIMQYLHPLLPELATQWHVGKACECHYSTLLKRTSFHPGTVKNQPAHSIFLCRDENTLTSCGLEKLFLQLCCCVSFWFWWEIGFGVTYLCTQSTIQLWCCVRFLVLAGNIFLCYGSTQRTIQLCSCVSFLVMMGNSSQNENTFLQKNLIGLLYYDPLANVCLYKT